MTQNSTSFVVDFLETGILMTRVRPLLISLLAVCLPTTCGADEQEQFFRESVEPILREYCYACHSHAAQETSGGLALDWKSGWETGGERGPAIVPGEPEKSLLITPSTYAAYQAQSLSVTVTNACETRQIPIKLQPCSGADPQVLKEIFTTTTTPSCKAANNVDLKTYILLGEGEEKEEILRNFLSS